MNMRERSDESKVGGLWRTLEDLCSTISGEMADAIYAGEASPWWRVDRKTLVTNPLSMISEPEIEEVISDSIDTCLRLLSQSFLADILSARNCPDSDQWIKTAFMPLLLELVPIAIEVELMREILRPLPQCVLSVDFAQSHPPHSVSRSINPRLGTSDILLISSFERTDSVQASLATGAGSEKSPKRLLKRRPRAQTFLTRATMVRTGFAIFERLLRIYRCEKPNTTLISEPGLSATFLVQLSRLLPNIQFSLGVGAVVPDHEHDTGQPRSDLFQVDHSLSGRIAKSTLEQLPISLVERLPRSLDLVTELCPVNNDLVVIGTDLSERTLIALANASARGRAVVFYQHGFPYEFLNEKSVVGILELTGIHINRTSRRPFVPWNNHQGAGGTGSLRLSSLTKTRSHQARHGRFYLEATVPPHRGASLISSGQTSLIERNPMQAESRSAHLFRSTMRMDSSADRRDPCGLIRVAHPAGRRYDLKFPTGPLTHAPYPLLGRKLIPSAEYVVFENFSTGIAEALFHQTPFSIYCPSDWYAMRSENEELRDLLTACGILITSWGDVEKMVALSVEGLDKWHRSSEVQFARASLAEHVVGPPFSVRVFADTVKNALVTPCAP